MNGAGGTCGSCPRQRNTYNRDYFGETADGSQVPMLNVFHRDGETVRHFWGAELTYGPSDPGQDHRSVGTLEPLWNLFDLTPGGAPGLGRANQLPVIELFNCGGDTNGK